MRKYEGKIEYVNLGPRSYLRVLRRLNRSIPTRSEESWPRETFIDDGDNIYFVSFNEEGARYLVEASIRAGMGSERMEAEWTVAEIEDQIGEIESTQQVVELLVDDLTQNQDAFPPPPSLPEPKIMNPPVEEGDILFGGRGVNGISLDQREKLREMIRKGSVGQDKLPPGTVKITQPNGPVVDEDSADAPNPKSKGGNVPPGSVRVKLPNGEERIVKPKFEVQEPPKQV